MLTHGASTQARDSNGWTALHLAAATNHAAVCRTLLDIGADPLAADRGGNTPLHLAAAAGATEATAVLAARSLASLETLNATGAVPLRVGIQAGAAGCVRALLRAGARASTAAHMGPVGSVAEVLRLHSEGLLV
jgi:ankyrin repeat protein